MNRDILYRVVVLLCAIAFLGGCDDKPDKPRREQAGRVPDVPYVPQAGQTSPGAPAAATGDFAQERAAFRTKLSVHGPSPQPSDRENPPAGVSEVTYSSGELKLKAWISQTPADGKKHPAVLYCHGGFSFGADDWQQSKPYRDAGFIVMMPMLRGENGNPGEFEMFCGEVDDAIAAGKYLAGAQGVDANHVFIAGHSAGGTITGLAALLPNPFAAAASFGGTIDAGEFVASPEWRAIAPFDPSDASELRMRSSKPHLESIRCPLMLAAGSGDRYAASRIAALKTQQLKPAKELAMVIVPGDHFKSVDALIRQSIAFFKRVAP